MQFVCRSLLEAIVYIESRDVPDDIADNDVRALEEVFYTLNSADESERDELVSIARRMTLETSDPKRIQTLEAIIETLQS